jgi:hypothetical protein
MSTSYMRPSFMDNKQTEALRTDTIKILCDPSAAASNWISQIIADAPSIFRGEILLNILRALNFVRGMQRHEKAGAHTSYHGDNNGLCWLTVGRTCYYIIDLPQSIYLCKWEEDINSNYSPVLLIASSHLPNLRRIVRQGRILDRLTLFAFEAFLNQALLFHSSDKKTSVFESWWAVVEKYNQQAANTLLPSIIIGNPPRNETGGKKQTR